MPDRKTEESHARITGSTGEETGNGASSREVEGEEPAETDEEYLAKLSHYLGQLEDENDGVRWKAAESLGRLGDPAAVRSLIDTLWDDDARVRMKAAWALGEIGDPHALPALQKLYRMENENVREIIERAMTAIKRQMITG